MKKTFLLVSLFLFVISCATPTVVNVVGPNDSKMSCSQLDVEIAMANKLSLIHI